MDGEGYSQRSGRVRGRARDHLRRLREDRARRRTAEAVVADAQPTAPPPDPMTITAMAASGRPGAGAGSSATAGDMPADPQPELAVEPTGATADAEPPIADGSATSAPDTGDDMDAALGVEPGSGTPNMAGDRSDDQQSADAPVPEAADDRSVAPEPDVTDADPSGDADHEKADDAVADAGPSGPAAPPGQPDDCDLYELPGAGSGLVWMLSTEGIRSLDDLADADPEDLSTQLGIVAQILDVGYWIAWARDRRASSGTD